MLTSEIAKRPDKIIYRNISDICNCLKTLETRGSVSSFKEIASSFSVVKATAWRYVKILEDCGFVSVERNQYKLPTKYSLTPEGKSFLDEHRSHVTLIESVHQQQELLESKTSRKREEIRQVMTDAEYISNTYLKLRGDKKQKMLRFIKKNIENITSSGYDGTRDSMIALKVLMEGEAHKINGTRSPYATDSHEI